VFEREIEQARIVLALLNDEPAGYLYHGAFGPILKIHQACIQYDARGQLYGAQLVSWLVSLCRAANVCSISLRCGSDIAANAFWQAMGFHCQAVTPGGIRRARDINNWRLDITPQLFVLPVDPSTRKQDSSMWRKHKDGTQSQFMRGAALRAYRKSIEAKAKT
jgi:GNAT superfamily N-acetyltransferase